MSNNEDLELLRQYYSRRLTNLNAQLSQIQSAVQQAMATVDRLIVDGTPSPERSVQGWVDLDGDYWHADPERAGWAIGYTTVDEMDDGLFSEVTIGLNRLTRWYGPLTPIEA